MGAGWIVLVLASLSAWTLLAFALLALPWGSTREGPRETPALLVRAHAAFVSLPIVWVLLFLSIAGRAWAVAGEWPHGNRFWVDEGLGIMSSYSPLDPKAFPIHHALVLYLGVTVIGVAVPLGLVWTASFLVNRVRGASTGVLLQVAGLLGLTLIICNVGGLARWFLD